MRCIPTDYVDITDYFEIALKQNADCHIIDIYGIIIRDLSFLQNIKSFYLTKKVFLYLSSECRNNHSQKTSLLTSKEANLQACRTGFSGIY